VPADHRFRIVRAGDSAVVVELEERIDPAVNARAIDIAAAVVRTAIAGVRDVVPTYRSVAIYFDPLRTDFDALLHVVEREAAIDHPVAEDSGRPVRVPVCYGGALGPDLADVARFAGLSESDVVRIHAGATYRVFMLGFVAGFAYMGTVDKRIAAPRRSAPRVHVPLGSVGIAGVQTGIYPAETPGGWNLIGRTPLKPFDPDRDPPFLLKAGDRVTFDPIDAEAFERVRGGGA